MYYIVSIQKQMIEITQFNPVSRLVSGLTLKFRENSGDLTVVGPCCWSYRYPLKDHVAMTWSAAPTSGWQPSTNDSDDNAN